ncbi:ester cyclase [Vibrio sp. 1F279]|uniref:ester cyclase n=1 Tax=unclassified Vibrio TaxID=2614977 RepID=UPI00352E49E7
MTSKQVQVVKDYFKHCVDGKQTHRIGEYFAENTMIHRPDCNKIINGLSEFEAMLKVHVTERYESLETTFQKVVEDGHQVVVALTHRAKGADEWKGYQLNGKNVTWTSLTYFRFNDEGKVVEEIVERNELSMALQLGLNLTS